MHGVASVAVFLGVVSLSSFASAQEAPVEAPSVYPPATEDPVFTYGPVREKPSRRFEYHEGMDVPEGYHLEETPRWGLVAGGTSVLATFWAVSAISAVMLDREAADEGDPNFDDMYWPMFIPVAGPFVTIGTADSSGTGAAILALDGVVQAAGLGMFIAGFAAPKVEIVEDYHLTVAPSAPGSQGGMSISGSF
jgi:hypothetical protein